MGERMKFKDKLGDIERRWRKLDRNVDSAVWTNLATELYLLLLSDGDRTGTELLADGDRIGTEFLDDSGRTETEDRSSEGIRYFEQILKNTGIHFSQVAKSTEDYLSEICLEACRLYDPSKGHLVNFISSRLKARIIDDARKKAGITGQPRVMGSRNIDSSNVSDSYASGDSVPNDNADFLNVSGGSVCNSNAGLNSANGSSACGGNVNDGNVPNDNADFGNAVSAGISIDKVSRNKADGDVGKLKKHKKSKRVAEIGAVGKSEAIVISSIDEADSSKDEKTGISPLDRQSLNQWQNEGSADFDKHFVMDAQLSELASQILHFMKRHKGSQATERNRMFYELFYSTDIINYLKVTEDTESFQHERDIMSAMHFSYTNFCTDRKDPYMREEAITPCAIVSKELAKNGEVLPYDKVGKKSKADNDERLAIPLQNEVVRGYLEREEDDKVSSALISNKMKKYMQDMYESLKSKDLSYAEIWGVR